MVCIVGTLLRATERRLPHEITLCYLPSNTDELFPPYPQSDRPVLNYLTPEGWKAELTWLVDYNAEMVYLFAQSPIQLLTI